MTEEEAVLATLEEYAEAYCSKDIDRLMALFDDGRATDGLSSWAWLWSRGLRLRSGEKPFRRRDEVYEPLGQRVEPGLRLGSQDHALLAEDTRQRRLGAADEGPHTTPT